MPSLRVLIFVPLLCVVVALLSGCQTDPRLRKDLAYLGGYSAKDEARAHFDNYSHWDGDGVSGAPSIVIRLSEQRAYFYKSGALVGVASISTGREGFGTPTGSFRIQQKDKDHASSAYGDYVDASGKVVMRDIDRKKDPMPPGARFDGAKMPFFMRINGGVGMHEGFLPGEPASHGCIRMTRAMAQAFFRNVEVGTPVVIQP
jgi:lipoprotein-anchoring transpeptidase ErfK/SrfK